MILSGLQIDSECEAGVIQISPYSKSRLNPNSYNLRLADKLLVYRSRILDVKSENIYNIITIPPGGMVLEPGRLYLGQTMEWTKTDRYVPMLDGRSSMGRLGLFVHVTAGFGDVGFTGYWTLELACVQPVIIYPGIEICQISYHTIAGDYETYQSDKYQENNGVQPSMSWKDFIYEEQTQNFTEKY